MEITRNEIIEKLFDIFKMVIGSDIINEKEISESSRLIEDLGLSSVSILYMIICIEESFSIRFENVKFGEFKTIKNVIDYLEKRVNK